MMGNLKGSIRDRSLGDLYYYDLIAHKADVQFDFSVNN